MQFYIPDKFVQSQHLPRKINWAGIFAMTPHVSTGSSTIIELNWQETAVVSVTFVFFNHKKRVRNNSFLQHSHGKDFQRQATKRRSRRWRQISILFLFTRSFCSRPSVAHWNCSQDFRFYFEGRIAFRFFLFGPGFFLQSRFCPK